VRERGKPVIHWGLLGATAATGISNGGGTVAGDMQAARRARTSSIKAV
jgi:hypothetical protein